MHVHIPRKQMHVQMLVHIPITQILIFNTKIHKHMTINQAKTHIKTKPISKLKSTNIYFASYIKKKKTEID